jgi:hypothetical protein
VPVLSAQEQFALIPVAWTLTSLAVLQGPQTLSVGGGGGGIVIAQTQTQATRALGQQAKNFAVYHTCGTSPNDAVISWMRDGAVHGAFVVGYSGFVGGEGLEPLGGGAFGLFVGGVIGGVVGGGGGVLEGTAVAEVCSVMGAYGGQ